MDLLLYLPSSTIFYFLIGLLAILSLVFLFAINKTHFIIYFLLLWFPLESLVLNYVPILYYSYVKYIPEVILYLFGIGALIHYWRTKKTLFPKTPLNKWFAMYLVVAVISLVLNWYDSFIWALGLRQVLRFSLVLFIVLFLNFPQKIIKKLLLLGGAMIATEAVLGLVQYAFGGSLDNYLFPNRIVPVGGIAILGGEEAFWVPGSRVFATMGRYDQLGSFLTIGLVMLFPWLYYFKKPKQKIWWAIGMAVGSLTLLLTMSRASWIATFLGITVIGIIHHRDKRIYQALGVFIIGLIIYLAGFILVHSNVTSLTERPNQSLAERILEAGSFGSWQASYEGYGRIFFIINTPMMVVASAPFFGVGPGNYGGGAAAALVNTDVYDRLHLPFGIQNIYGQIDNNWMSIWGEVGTLGLIAWTMILLTIFKTSKRVAIFIPESTNKAIAEGVMGLTVGVMAIGFFGPYFEFRSLMFYFWLASGIIILAHQENIKSGNFIK